MIAGFRSVLFVSCFKGCLSFKKIRGVPSDKNIPEILVGNFRSVITIRAVYHLPKFSDCRAALDWILVTTSKLRTKLKKLVNGKRISIRNVPTRKTGLLFQNFCFSREFSSGMNKKKTVIAIYINRNFREFVVNGRQPRFLCFVIVLFQAIIDQLSLLQRFFRSFLFLSLARIKATSASFLQQEFPGICG